MARRKAISQTEESTGEQSGFPEDNEAPNPVPSGKTDVAYVCTQETFWQNRLWKVGQITSDPGAQGNCFVELK